MPKATLWTVACLIPQLTSEYILPDSEVNSPSESVKDEQTIKSGTEQMPFIDYVPSYSPV